MGLISSLLETRIHPSNESEWLTGTFGTVQTKSGRAVNEVTALQATAVFACIRAIAETLGSLPLITYRSTGDDGGRERAVDHPLFPLLHDQANPEMPAGVFRETLTAHAVSWGNGYAEIEFNRGGQPIALWPLLPDRTWPVRRDKVLSYRTIVDNREVGLPANRVLHVAGMGFDGLVGYSPIHLFRESIGLALAAEELGARFFGSGMKPAGILEYPGHFENDEKRREFRRVFEEAAAGLTMQQRTMILEDGMKFNPMSIPPDDAQFLETRKFQLREIARMFRVQPHVIQDLEQATFTNIEHQGLEFIIYSLQPWFGRWEQAIQSRLITVPGMFAEHLVDGLARGDLAARYAAYNTGRMGGWLSANDIRRLENMNPIPGDAGNVYLVALNMASMDSLLDDEFDESSDDGDISAGLLNDDDDRSHPVPRHLRGRDDGPRLRSTSRRSASRSEHSRRRIQRAHMPLIEGVAKTVLRKEIDAARKALARGSSPLLDLELWIEDFYPDHIARMVTRFKPVVTALAVAIAEEAGREIDADGILDQDGDDFIGEYTATLAARMASSSRGQLRRLIDEARDEAELQAAVEARLSEWETKRPGKVALRETVQLGNAVTKAVWTFNGIRQLVWRTSGENCPLCEEMDGRVVEITRSFLSAGDQVNPGVEGTAPLDVTQSFGHPPLHEGCDCSIAPG